MKTLKELYWEDFGITSRRIETMKNRKGMIYAAKYYDIPKGQFDYHDLHNELASVGCKFSLPQHRYISVGNDGTLVIVHAKENSKLLEALKQLGYEESEAVE